VALPAEHDDPGDDTQYAEKDLERDLLVQEHQGQDRGKERRGINQWRRSGRAQARYSQVIKREVVINRNWLI
jgi:hypothetical protein